MQMEILLMEAFGSLYQTTITRSNRLPQVDAKLIICIHLRHKVLQTVSQPVFIPQMIQWTSCEGKVNNLL